MEWILAAWIVVVLHLGFLVFQMLGALLALVSPHWLVPHLATAAWGIGIVVVQGSCPLTTFEKHLIERAGSTPYTGSFLDYYLFGTVLPDGSQAFVYGTHLVVILASYVYVVPRLRRRPMRRDQGSGAATLDAGLSGGGGHE